MKRIKLTVKNKVISPLHLTNDEGLFLRAYITLYNIDVTHFATQIGLSRKRLSLLINCKAFPTLLEANSIAYVTRGKVRMIHHTGCPGKRRNPLSSYIQKPKVIPKNPRPKLEKSYEPIKTQGWNIDEEA